MLRGCLFRTVKYYGLVLKRYFVCNIDFFAVQRVYNIQSRPADVPLHSVREVPPPEMINILPLTSIIPSVTSAYHHERLSFAQLASAF